MQINLDTRYIRLCAQDLCAMQSNHEQLATSPAMNSTELHDKKLQNVKICVQSPQEAQQDLTPNNPA